MTNKNKKSRGFFLCVALALSAALAGCDQAPKQITPKQALTSPPAYDYPINNPYAATIIGMPPKMQVDYSSVPAPEDERITLYKDRPVPEGFWYERGLRYSYLLQKSPAPLVYVIGGTGADSHSKSTLMVADILYSGGFNVVMLPSPTHPNFIINASSNYFTGRPSQDAADLYRLMQTIDAKILAKTKVTGRMLVGYSLGAVDAAFTAQLDSERGSLNFSRVMLINPPYSLYSSMQNIDRLLYSALPGGINQADSFVKTAVRRLSSVSQSSDALDFANERTLIDAYNTYQPSDNRLATLIGLSFRLAGADMIFTTDVMSHSNYIFPGNEEFTTSTSLNSTLSLALRTSFRNYFDDIYAEKYLKDDPHLNRKDLLAEGDLVLLKDYFSSHPQVGMMTNADDVILAQGEPAKLRALFGGNATVYPNGGHLGNLGDPAVAYHLVHFLMQD